MWDEYCRLRKEVKQLVIEKKLNIWNELVEKVNTDFDENRKEFWAFVGSMKDPLSSSLAGCGSPLDLTEIRRLQDFFTRTTYNLYTKTHKHKEVQTKTSNNNYTSDRYILL